MITLLLCYIYLQLSIVLVMHAYNNILSKVEKPRETQTD